MPWLASGSDFLSSAGVDTARAIEALGLVFVLAALVERGLAPFFESGLFAPVMEKPGTKQFVALIAAEILVWNIGFDAIAMARHTTAMPAGVLATGFAVSLGARGAAAVVVGMLGIRSNFLNDQISEGAQKGVAWTAATEAGAAAPANTETLKRGGTS